MNKRQESITVAGKTFASVNAAATFFGVKLTTARQRIYAGWPLAQVFEVERRRQSFVTGGVVYSLLNLKTGKRYIGVTNRDVHVRFRQHVTTARHNDHKLAQAIRKYGADTFLVSVLAKTKSNARLQKLELKYIDLFDTIENGYNSVRSVKTNRESATVSILGNEFDSVSHFIRVSGLSKGIVYKRIQEDRTDFENRQPFKKPVTVNNVAYASISEASRNTGIKMGTLYYRLKHGLIATAPAHEARV